MSKRIVITIGEHSSEDLDRFLTEIVGIIDSFPEIELLDHDVRVPLLSRITAFLKP